MEFIEIENILNGNEKKSKIELLSHLSDVFESYNKDIAHFHEMIDLLIQSAVTEQDAEVQVEIFDTLLDAATYQDTQKENWDVIVQHMDDLPMECLSTAVSILGLSHNKKYVPMLRRLAEHDKKAVRASALVALSEMGAR